MTIYPLDGCHFVHTSQKRHYFKDGRSLCGRVHIVSLPVSDALNRSDVADFYNCVHANGRCGPTGAGDEGNLV